MTKDCSCECHYGPGYVCSVSGGCGPGDCGRHDRRVACIVCPALYPDRDPRQPEGGKVCDGCRFRISRDLADISRYTRLLLNPDPVEYDDRWYEATGHEWDQATEAWIPFVEDRRNDPLGALGGVAPIPSRTKQPSVSGSREKPVPVRVDVLDLTGPARQFNPTRDRADQPNQKPDDAAGHLSAATVLDSWARDWRDVLFPDLHLPPATVDELVRWFRVGADHDNPGTRIDEACDSHSAIDEFADEIHRLRQALRRAAGETEPQPQPCIGVECQRCSLRTLYWRTDGTGGVECVNPDCMRLYDLESFRLWTAHLAGYEKSIRPPDEIAELMRGN